MSDIYNAEHYVDFTAFEVFRREPDPDRIGMAIRYFDHGTTEQWEY